MIISRELDYPSHFHVCISLWAASTWFHSFFVTHVLTALFKVSHRGVVRFLTAADTFPLTLHTQSPPLKFQEVLF